MFSFFSVLLLDDTSKRPLIPHVTKFILLIRSPTGAGSLAALLPNLGPISRPMQMVANGSLTVAPQLVELQIIMLNITVLSRRNIHSRLFPVIM